MLLVYVLMIKWILKKWCTPKLFVFVCYLLCYVLCLPYSVIIPVLHHGLIWLLAFLRNRFWLKDNSNSLTLSRNENRYSCVFTIISHCASFNIVCGLHPGNMLSDINWNTVYSLNIDIFEAFPPSPALPQHQILSSLFYLLKTKSLMCGCTVLISIQFGLWKPLLTISLEIDKRNSSGWVVENLLSLFDH